MNLIKKNIDTIMSSIADKAWAVMQTVLFAVF
jgi:hypothetical protein